MLIKDCAESPQNGLIIFGDNQGSIALVINRINHSNSKHIDIKFHFICEKYSKGLIEPKYVPSNDNIADLMRKPATKAKFDKFKQLLFGR